jgi:hypothetical protein
VDLDLRIGRNWGILLGVIVAAAALSYVGILVADGPNPGNTPVAQRTDNTLHIPISGSVNQDIVITNALAGPPDTGDNTLHITSTDELRMGVLTLSGSTCRDLTVRDSEIGLLTLTGNRADGNSFGSTPTTTVAVVIPTTPSDDPLVYDGDGYDRILIDTGADGGLIRDLTISASSLTSAPCVIEGVHANELRILDNTFGQGNGLVDKDFKIESSVLVGSVTSTNNDELLTEVP